MSLMDRSVYNSGLLNRDKINQYSTKDLEALLVLLTEHRDERIGTPTRTDKVSWKPFRCDSGMHKEYHFAPGSVVSIGKDVYSHDVGTLDLRLLGNGFGGSNDFGGKEVHISMPVGKNYPATKLMIDTDGTIRSLGDDKTTVENYRGNGVLYVSSTGAPILGIYQEACRGLPNQEKDTRAMGSSVYRNRAGDLVIESGDGSCRMIKRKDGSMDVINLANGSRLTLNKEGNTVFHAPSGGFASRDKNGIRTFTTADGNISTEDRHGNKVFSMPGGESQTEDKDGNKAFRTLDGRSLFVDKNGSTVMLNADGTEMRGGLGSVTKDSHGDAWIMWQALNGDRYVSFAQNHDQSAVIDGITDSDKGLDRFRTGTNGRSLFIPHARSVSFPNDNGSARQYSRGTANDGGITMRNGITKRNGRLTVS